jgi:hypothetical protein
MPSSFAAALDVNDPLTDKWPSVIDPDSDVYSRDGEARARLTRMATAWAELARAAGSLDDSEAQAR